MLGSLQCLAESSVEGLGSSSILVGWSLCDLDNRVPSLIHLFTLKMRMAFSLPTSLPAQVQGPHWPTERWKLAEVFLVGSGSLHRPQWLLPYFLQAQDSLERTCSS